MGLVQVGLMLGALAWRRSGPAPGGLTPIGARPPCSYEDGDEGDAVAPASREGNNKDNDLPPAIPEHAPASPTNAGEPAAKAKSQASKAYQMLLPTHTTRAITDTYAFTYTCATEHTPPFLLECTTFEF